MKSEEINTLSKPKNPPELNDNVSSDYEDLKPENMLTGKSALHARISELVEEVKRLKRDAKYKDAKILRLKNKVKHSRGVAVDLSKELKESMANRERDRKYWSARAERHKQKKREIVKLLEQYRERFVKTTTYWKMAMGLIQRTCN